MFAKKVRIPNEYSNFINVFLEEKALILQECDELNKYTINLEDGKQPSYGSIYSPGPIELKTFKTYIETHLKIRFIQPFKSLTRTPILFDKKPDGNFRLCVDYQGFNNLIIKNRYLLLLIEESFKWLGRAKRFTQLDLSNAYYQMRIKEGNK